MRREAPVIAKWLLIAYATAMLAFLCAPAFLALGSGETDVLLLSVPMLAWIVGPAAVAAWLAVRATSGVEAWLFIVAEAAAVASTAWLCVVLLLSTGSQNAQSGIALVLLPALQWPLLASYASAVIGAVLIRRDRSARAAEASHEVAPPHAKTR